MKTKIKLAGILLFFILINPRFLHSQNANNQALATIEVTGDAMAYNTYCFIGSINDGYWTSTWTRESTLGWLDDQISTLNSTEIQYHSFLGSGFAMSSADSAYINDLSYEFSYLKIEAGALENYINNPNDETRKAYLDARDDAWQWLNLIDYDLLGKK